jgi:hypothetical protein
MRKLRELGESVGPTRETLPTFARIILTLATKPLGRHGTVRGAGMMLRQHDDGSIRQANLEVGELTDQRERPTDVGCREGREAVGSPLDLCESCLLRP